MKAAFLSGEYDRVSKKLSKQYANLTMKVGTMPFHRLIVVNCSQSKSRAGCLYRKFWRMKL